MYYVITVLIIIASVLLSLIVLIQKSKGGGLAANFSSSNQIMGVRKTTDFLEKATWTLAIALAVFCIVSSAAIPKGQEKASKMESRLKQPDESQIPNITPQMTPDQVAPAPEE